MTAQIENDSKEPLVGDISLPNERHHVFSTDKKLNDFVLSFGIKNYNVRYLPNHNGQMVYVLVYEPVNE